MWSLIYANGQTNSKHTYRHADRITSHPSQTSFTADFANRFIDFLKIHVFGFMLHLSP